MATTAERPRVVPGLVLRSSWRGAVAWGAVFGTFYISSATAFSSAYPDAASRLKLVSTLGHNAGVAAMLGPARAIDTPLGFTTWRAGVFTSVVGAVWGLLTATRCLRGEEDATRWDLLVVGPTTPTRAAGEGLAGLGAAWLVLWAATAALVVPLGLFGDTSFSVPAALYLATTITASAAVFILVGAVCAQLADRRSQAAAVAGVVLGLSFALRMLADSTASLSWLRWATPLGWVEELRPLTGTRPAPLIPLVLLAVALSVATLRLAALRDTGGGLLPRRDSARARTTLLGSPLGLNVRLARPATLGWLFGISLGALVFGLIAKAAGESTAGSSAAQDIYEKLGAKHFGAASYLGAVLLILSLLIALAGAGRIAALRREEADGRVDHLLSQPVHRPRWLGGHTAITLVAALVMGVAMGVTAYVGAAVESSGVGARSLLEAGVYLVVPAVFVVGLATCAYGFSPRLAAPFAYAVIVWSFLIEFAGSLLDAPGWLLDTAVFHHIALVPAADPNWGSAAVIAGIGLAGAAAGIVAFSHRDLAGA